jgi:hypothetical protein
VAARSPIGSVQPSMTLPALTVPHGHAHGERGCRVVAEIRLWSAELIQVDQSVDMWCLEIVPGDLPITLFEEESCVRVRNF